MVYDRDMNSTAQYVISYGFNYARLSYGHELFHIVGWPGALKPHAKAACGISRISQTEGERPTWEDCRTLPPEKVCPMCMRARGH